MTTSGSIDFSTTRDLIIQDAFFTLNVYGPSDEISDEDISFAARKLNSMIKAWQNDEIHIWAYDEGVLFLTPSTNSYSLPGARACRSADFVRTTVSADEASGQTVISVTSNTGMAINDVVGVVLDDNTTHWTTISAVGSGTITLNDATTYAASDGNSVFTYTTAANRPFRITSARLQRTDQYEVPLNEIGRLEYRELPNKTATGSPSMFFYDPGNATGKFYLYTTPDDPEMYVNYTFVRTFEDFDNSTDEPDFPQEWYDALVYNLAYRLAPTYGKGGDALVNVQAMAVALLNGAKDRNTELTSTQFVPDKKSLR